MKIQHLPYRRQALTKTGVFSRAALVTSLLWILAGPAHANYISAGKLYNLCIAAGITDPDEQQVSKVICSAYVSGVSDATELMARRGKNLRPMKTPDGRRVHDINGFRWCEPARSSIQGITDRVVEYLAAHPEMHQDYAAADEVAKALQAAYPCS